MLIWKPKLIGPSPLSDDILTKDRKSCRKIGPCGLGEKALYLSTPLLDRRLYAQFADIRRIYKRIAMSKGGFSGRGIFGSIPYLVVEISGDRQQVCRFRYEEEVDMLIQLVHDKLPQIPIYSREGEARLAKARALEESRYLKQLPPEAESSIRSLQAAQRYLRQQPRLWENLSFTARQKRTIDRINPSYRTLAVIITLMGFAAVCFGLYAFIRNMGTAMYFLLFGFAAIFLMMSSQILPSGGRTRKGAEAAWQRAVQDMARYLEGSGTTFPVAAVYAHPAVLERMIRVIREGRAVAVDEARRVMAADLQRLNADVTVSQTEYDEVVAVKPLFLVNAYADLS